MSQTETKEAKLLHIFHFQICSVKIISLAKYCELKHCEHSKNQFLSKSFYFGYSCKQFFPNYACDSSELVEKSEHKFNTSFH